jgi:hypothetical protein
MKKIVLSSISKNNAQAQEHFEKEINQPSIHPILWSGEVNGKDQVGDHFGFVKHETDDLLVSDIIEVFDSSVQRSWWTGERRCQKTVVVRPGFKRLSWSKFKQDAGYKDNLVLNGNKRLRFPY